MRRRFVGYHGTTLESASQILNGRSFRFAERDGLWLGRGVYFFEDGPEHARSWAQNVAAERSSQPAVIEVVIEADYIIDLSDKLYWSMIRETFEQLKSEDSVRDQIGPQGIWNPVERRAEKFGHNYLDFDVMNRFLELYCGISNDQGIKFDMVRCPFIAGDQVYEKSWFFRRACIMISVLRLDAIKSLSLVNN